MQYRKKPVIIDAMQFCGSNQFEIHVFTKGKSFSVYNDNDHVYVETLEGTMTCNIFDWVIQGVQGELYPCKADIFKETYEEVREECPGCGELVIVPLCPSCKVK